MPGHQPPDDIQQTGQYNNPRRLKVKRAAPAVLIGQHVAVASRDQSSRGRNWYLEQGRGQHIPGFAPIEAGMGDDNFHSADEQCEETQRSDPVSRTDECGVPRRGRGGGNRDRTWETGRTAHREMVSREVVDAINGRKHVGPHFDLPRRDA